MARETSTTEDCFEQEDSIKHPLRFFWSNVLISTVFGLEHHLQILAQIWRQQNSTLARHIHCTNTTLHVLAPVESQFLSTPPTSSMKSTKFLCTASLLLPNAISAARWSTLQTPIYQIPSINSSPTVNRIKVPGASPAYYCSDPSDNVFQIDHLDFIPINPRV